MKKMKLHSILILSFIINSFFMISVEAAAAQENVLLRIEKSRSSDDITEPEIASIGAFSTSGGKIAHFDIINFDSTIEGKVWGFDMGLGYPFSSGGSPLIMYLGFGVLLGYNTDQSDYIFGYYPEVGLIYSLKQGVGITATAKRYSSVYDDAVDAVMIGILLKY